MAEAAITDEELSASMDDTIRDELARLMPEDDSATPAPGVKQSLPEEGSETPAAAETRARDESGKFVKKESAPAETPNAAKPGPATSPDTTPQPDADTPLVTTTGQPIDLNRPPSSWKPAAKAAWAALPEVVRQDIYRREQDFLNGGKGLKEAADFGQNIRSKFQPYHAIMQAEGATPEAAIDDYLRTAAVLRLGSPQQKLQAVFDLDKRFNTGLGAYFQQQVQAAVAQQTGQAPQAQPVSQQPQVYSDPRVDQILTSLQAQERGRAAQQEEISNQAVERFIAAKDEKGIPLYPFVDNVSDDMSARVAQIRQANPSLAHDEVLKQAYDAAVWANPETRAVLISQQQAPVQAQVDTLRKAEAAKRASGLNMPKRGALPAGEALGTMDDTIRDTYRQLTG